MRAVWWLLKLGWLAATRVRRALGPAEGYGHPAEWMMGARLDPDEAPPRANLADYVKSLPPEEQETMRGLAQSYARTFCGKCGAGPLETQRRCATCMELLTRVIEDEHGGEAEKLATAVRLIRTGRR